MKLFSSLALVLMVLFAVLHGENAAGSVTVPAVGDKYMYPFIDDSETGGRRGYAGIWGAYGSFDDPVWDFDDRDAQFFLDFATSEEIPHGQGASNYKIAKLEVTIVSQLDDTFLYDPNFDPLGTYNGAADDLDLGRPLELYGVGYRSGFSRDTFSEDSAFQTEPSIQFTPTWNRKRNAYAIDFGPDGTVRDVSNNVQEGFETNPWAVADSPGYIDFDGVYFPGSLADGSSVNDGRVFRFQADLDNPRIMSYLQESLNAGRLHLMVSSLYGTAQRGVVFPRFYTKDFNDPDIDYYLGPQLLLDVLLTPTTSVTRVGSSYRLSFDTVTGQNYQVEYRDSLTSGDWLPLGDPRSGTGATLNHDDTPPDGVGSRFYRVAVSKNTQP